MKNGERRVWIARGRYDLDVSVGVIGPIMDLGFAGDEEFAQPMTGGEYLFTTCDYRARLVTTTLKLRNVGAQGFRATFWV